MSSNGRLRKNRDRRKSNVYSAIQAHWKKLHIFKSWPRRTETELSDSLDLRVLTPCRYDSRKSRESVVQVRQTCFSKPLTFHNFFPNLEGQMVESERRVPFLTGFINCGIFLVQKLSAVRRAKSVPALGGTVKTFFCQASHKLSNLVLRPYLAEILKSWGPGIYQSSSKQ